MPIFDGVPAGNFTFPCLDGHTCGNPVRLVIGGAPILHGATMSERRQDFAARFDWVRRALMFEPRGHDVMSGGILYPPLREDCDIAILYIEVTGCLPMCGHGTIGAVTMALEHGLVTPRQEGVVAIDAPAGRVLAEYARNGAYVELGAAAQCAVVPGARSGDGAGRGAWGARRRHRLWRQFLRDRRAAARFRRTRRRVARLVAALEPGAAARRSRRNCRHRRCRRRAPKPLDRHRLRLGQPGRDQRAALGQQGGGDR